MSSLDDIEQRAALWLERRIEPSWTAEDQLALEAWLAESAAHQVAFWRLEHGWEKVARLAVVRPVEAPSSVRGLRSGSRVWGSLGVGIAAALLMAIAVPFQAPKLVAKKYVAPIGALEKVPLPDGSNLELGTNTELRAAVSATRRTVWLERGEAFFEVKRDSAHPFVVYAGANKVIVLGTKFSVRNDGDEVRVVVLSGRVQVETARRSSTNRDEILTAGQVALSNGASTLVASLTPEKVEGMLDWRRGMLTFDQTTLSDVAEEFNRYNRVKIVLGDPSVAQMRVGGTFQAQNVEAFARLLQSAYGLKVTRHEDSIEIAS